MNTAIENLLASALHFHQAGRLAEAVQTYQQILAAQPDHTQSRHALGLLTYRLGHYTLAIEHFQRALATADASPVHWYDLGLAYVAVGRFGDAAAAWETAVRLRPTYAEALNNLGIVCKNLGAVAQAVVHLRRAILLEPSYAAAHHNLGTALHVQGALLEAKASFEEALRLRPGFAEATNGLGMVLHELGDIDGAMLQFRYALAQRPNFADASNNLATVLKETGALSEARAQFRITLQLRPDHPNAHYHLSQFAAAGHGHYGAEQFAYLKSLANADRGRPLDRSVLCFAVASLLDARGDYHQAFEYFRRGNELRRHMQARDEGRFDADEHRALVDRIVSVFDRAYFAKVRGWQTATDLPIFIIGMPRSGSTLLEQILATDPKVVPAEELGRIPQIADQLANAAGQTDHYATSLPVPDVAAARTLAVDFLGLASRLGQGAMRLTDKTLENVLHLGLIATLFSNCRVIHCRRHPLDTCLSCYFQNFQRLDFVWSLEDIGVYYREYERLMAHWRRTLPLSIHEVNYEELIQHPEAVTRDLFDFCGLQWQPRCLEFFRNRYPVRTASSLQVRKPLSAASIGRWQHYASHLGPLLDALRDVAPAAVASRAS